MASPRVGCFLVCLATVLAVPEGQCDASEEQCSLLQTHRVASRWTANSSRPRVGVAKNFVIKNSCQKPIIVRKGPGDSMDNCPNAECPQDRFIEPGGTKEYPGFAPQHENIVLSWGDYQNFCQNAIFCTSLETNADWSMNFAHQRAFSMNVGVGFFKGGPSGQIPSNCPRSDPDYKGDSFFSTAGQMDTCEWDVGQACPDSAFLVATSEQALKDKGPFYCISPDRNLAVISELMDNPTQDECKKGAPAPAKTVPPGPDGTPPLCAPRTDVAQIMPLIPAVDLWDVKTEKQLTQKDFTDPIPQKGGGAKEYQHAVNKGCKNQPPTQRVEWADASKTQLRQKAGPLGFRMVPEGSKEKYVDHGITFEGDDANYYAINDEKVFFAGVVGIQCPVADFDTVVFEACPAS